MRKLAIFSFAFAAGTAVYLAWLSHLAALYAAGGLLAVSGLAFWKKWNFIKILSLGLGAALIWCSAYETLWLQPIHELEGTQTVLEMELTDLPEQVTYGCSGLVTVQLDGRTYPARLYDKKWELQDAAPGAQISGLVSVEKGDQYLLSRGIALQLYAREELTVLPGSPSRITAVRQWLRQRITGLYTGQRGGLVQALLTGDRSGLSDETFSDFNTAGLSHAVAVSGMHVSMLLTLVAFFCGKNPRLTAIVGIPAAIYFAFMTGATPSACRAVVMQVLVLSAPLLKRESDPPTTLGTAAMILLMQNPWVLTNVSFQLSFAAVAGLMLLGPQFRGKLLSLWKKPRRAAQWIATGLSTSFAAIAFTMPLMVWWFGRVSLAAPFVNLISLWAITGIFMLGLLSCVIPILAAPVSWLADFVLAVCHRTARLPFASASPENLPFLLWAVLLYGLVYLFLLDKIKRPILPLTAMTAALLAIALWGSATLVKGNPTYYLLDVGQGQCSLFLTEDLTAVFDCGGEDPVAAADALVQTLHSGCRTKVDVLVLTHYDDDHAGGVLQLLHRVDVETIFLPDVFDETGTRQAIEAKAQETGCRVFPVSSYTEVSFEQGKLTIFPPVGKENDNDRGICVLATAAEYDILITGDLDDSAEERLLSQWHLPQVELLVAGHHGAVGSTSQALLDQVRPETVAISVGGSNPYGHPSEKTLLRIEESGAKCYRTDLRGTLVFYGE